MTNRILNHVLTVELSQSTDNVGALLRQAADLIEENDGTLLSITYSNIIEGKEYHESVYVTFERGLPTFGGSQIGVMNS